jgi:threonine dehydrogenase-like Zn-dependent dehydrogenase
VRLTDEGRLDVREFTTHTFAMSDAPGVIDTIVERTSETIGVVLDHEISSSG